MPSRVTVYHYCIRIDVVVTTILIKSFLFEYTGTNKLVETLNEEPTVETSFCILYCTPTNLENLILSFVKRQTN